MRVAITILWCFRQDLHFAQITPLNDFYFETYTRIQSNLFSGLQQTQKVYATLDFVIDTLSLLLLWHIIYTVENIIIKI